MKAGAGVNFEQAYNTQLAVDTEGSYLILGAYVTNKGNDLKELAKGVDSISPENRQITEVLADGGYFNDEEIEEVEENGGPIVYCPSGKDKLYLKDAFNPEEVVPPGPGALLKEEMAHRLKSKEGRSKYKIRQQTV